MTHNPEVNSPAAKEARQVVASSGRPPSSGMQDWRMPLQDPLVIPPVVLIGPVSVGQVAARGRRATGYPSLRGRSTQMGRGEEVRLARLLPPPQQGLSVPDGHLGSGHPAGHDPASARSATTVWQVLAASLATGGRRGRGVGGPRGPGRRRPRRRSVAAWPVTSSRPGASGRSPRRLRPATGGRRCGAAGGVQAGQSGLFAAASQHLHQAPSGQPALQPSHSQGRAASLWRGRVRR
jgi:hypothetical protein